MRMAASLFVLRFFAKRVRTKDTTGKGEETGKISCSKYRWRLGLNKRD